MEFDQPYLLLQQEDGHFYRMVQQTGRTEADHLLEVARDCYRADVAATIPRLSSVHDDERGHKGKDMIGNDHKLGNDLRLDDSVFMSDTSQISFADDTDDDEKDDVMVNEIHAAIPEDGQESVTEEESGICSPSTLEPEALFESQPLVSPTSPEGRGENGEDENGQTESSHLLPGGTNNEGKS